MVQTWGDCCSVTGSAKFKTPARRGLLRKLMSRWCFSRRILGCSCHNRPKWMQTIFFADQSLNRMPYNFCINFDLSNKGTLSTTITSHRTTKGKSSTQKVPNARGYGLVPWSLNSMPPSTITAFMTRFLRVFKKPPNTRNAANLLVILGSSS